MKGTRFGAFGASEHSLSAAANPVRDFTIGLTTRYAGKGGILTDPAVPSVLSNATGPAGTDSGLRQRAPPSSQGTDFYFEKC